MQTYVEIYSKAVKHVIYGKYAQIVEQVTYFLRRKKNIGKGRRLAQRGRHNLCPQRERERERERERKKWMSYIED